MLKNLVTTTNKMFYSLCWWFQRYQPYIFDQYRQPDGQWETSSTTSPPTVPARGIKRSTPSEVTRPYEESSWVSIYKFCNVHRFWICWLIVHRCQQKNTDAT